MNGRLRDTIAHAIRVAWLARRGDASERAMGQGAAGRGDCSPDTPGAGSRHDAIRERIKSRAVRVSNRDRDAEARYLARHEPLIRGR